MDRGDELAVRLRDLALLALEDAVQECRYRTPPPSFAVRFAMAYLSAVSDLGREPFKALWSAMRRPHEPWSFTVADTALRRLYRLLGVERRYEVTSRMERKWRDYLDQA